MENLEKLYLKGENFTEAGLKEISKLRNLRSVRFLSPTSDAKAFESKFSTRNKANKPDANDGL